MNSAFNFTTALAIGLGATLGAWSRWWVCIILNSVLPNLPLGTLIVNLSGGLIMGMVLASVGLETLQHPRLLLFLTTGFLGGLTTFSAFTGESLALLQKQEYLWAFVHASSHVFGALLMAAVGYALIHFLRA